MNDFWNDNEWQRQKRDKYLSGFYGNYSQDGRYVYIEKSRFSMLVQKRLAADTLVQSHRGGSEGVEEKIVRYKGKTLTCFALETESCTVAGHESPGWMVYGEVDWLLYCFEVRGTLDLDCYLTDFQKLKGWFWEQNVDRFYRHVMPSWNKTATRLVPTTEVAQAVGAVRFLLAPDGIMKKLDPLEDRSFLRAVA